MSSSFNPPDLFHQNVRDMNTVQFKQRDTGLWLLRLALTQQMLFNGLKKLADQSGDPELFKTMNQKWFSGYDLNLLRMLPDGITIPGAPPPADLGIRHQIVADVLDGLKQRIRPGSDKVRSLFALTLAEYDLALAMCQIYQQITVFIEMGDELNPYAASQCETTVYAILNVLNEDDSVRLYKPLDDQDYIACAI